MLLDMRTLPTALSAQLYGTVARSSGGAGGITFTYYKSKVYPQLESIVASFDSLFQKDVCHSL